MIAFRAGHRSLFAAALFLGLPSPCLAQAADSFPEQRTGDCGGRGRTGDWTWIINSGFIALSNDHARRGTPPMIYTFSSARISSPTASTRNAVIATHYLWLPERTSFFRSVQLSRDGRPVGPIKQTFSGPMLDPKAYGAAKMLLSEELADFSDFFGRKARRAEYRLVEDDGRARELTVDLSGLEDALGRAREMLRAASNLSRKKGNAPEVCENVVPSGR